MCRNLKMLSQNIETYEQVTRISLLKYLSGYSDLEENDFYDKILHVAPKLKGDIMTVAEQWESRGIEKGKLETANKLLSMGLSIDKIIQSTGLSKIEIENIIKNNNH
jgi:predicted transposase/invertase (TIGR01784 family)